MSRDYRREGGGLSKPCTSRRLRQFGHGRAGPTGCPAPGPAERVGKARHGPRPPPPASLAGGGRFERPDTSDHPGSTEASRRAGQAARGQTRQVVPTGCTAPGSVAGRSSIEATNTGAGRIGAGPTARPPPRRGTGAARAPPARSPRRSAASAGTAPERAATAGRRRPAAASGTRRAAAGGDRPGRVAVTSPSPARQHRQPAEYRGQRRTERAPPARRDRRPSRPSPPGRLHGGQRHPRRVLGHGRTRPRPAPPPRRRRAGPPASRPARSRADARPSPPARPRTPPAAMRRGRRAPPAALAVEIGDQAARRAGQPPPVLVEVAVEPVQPFAAEVAGLVQDRRGRADRRHRRQHLVQRRGQPRIVGQPVRQRLDRRPPARRCGGAGRPTSPAQSGNRAAKSPARPGAAQPRPGRAQRRDQPGLGALGQHRRLDLQRPRQRHQQPAADSAPFVLDQVEIGRRDADPRRKIGLVSPRSTRRARIRAPIPPAAASPAPVDLPRFLHAQDNCFTVSAPALSEYLQKNLAT